MADEADGAVNCAICGRGGLATDWEWSRRFDLGRTSWLCPGCARDNLRSIEGKLDPEEG